MRMLLDRASILDFEKKKYKLFTYLLNNCDNICCCTSTNFRPSAINLTHDNVVANNGLVYNHAYSLLRAITVLNKRGKSTNLLKIRNPWNRRTNDKLQAQWHGDWSYKSKLWKSLDDDVKAGMDHNEGEFWISEKDWIKHFRVIDICYPSSYFDKGWKYLLKIFIF